MDTMEVSYELKIELLHYQPYSPDLAPNYFWLFTDFKIMFQEKGFVSDDEVIPYANVYFDGQSKSFLWKKYQNVSEALK